MISSVGLGTAESDDSYISSLLYAYYTNLPHHLSRILPYHADGQAAGEVRGRC